MSVPSVVASGATLDLLIQPLNNSNVLRYTRQPRGIMRAKCG
jgi:hypothetical protein